MSVPSSYAYPVPVTPHGRAGPAGNGPRVHSIVALTVILSLGTVSAFFAGIMGLFLADVCHTGSELACSNTFVVAMAVSSVPAVAIGAVLAGIGIGRARSGGGHGFAVAAWCVWGGFCLVWWVLVGMAGS